MTAKEIKQLIADLKLTQEEFAHRLPASCRSVSRWCCGISTPNRLSMRALKQVRETGKFED